MIASTDLFAATANAAWMDSVNWAKPEYSRNQVNRAGREIAKFVASGGRTEIDFSLYRVMQNWRAAHTRALDVFARVLRRRASQMDADSIVVQRLKREDSIVRKLARDDRARLATMQDIAGCRAVVTSTSELYGLIFALAMSFDTHELDGQRDYVMQPKADGYRSVHMIGRFHSVRPDLQIYNGMRVELQLRSFLQHAWATAVEIVDMFEGTELKFGKGPHDWTRFFALMSTFIAQKEGGWPTIPDTPTKPPELKSEIRALERKLRVRSRMETYAVGTMLSDMTNVAPDAYQYLLVLNPRKAKGVSITPYRVDEVERAIRDYNEAEAITRQQPHAYALLAAADSLPALKRGYLNYFANTQAFRRLLAEAIRE